MCSSDLNRVCKVDVVMGIGVDFTEEASKI